MMSEVVDLWPEFQVEKVRTPKIVLKEQAELLASKTHNVLKGEVVTDEHEHIMNPSRMTSTLYIVAPYLSNYKYSLLTITSDLLGVYPVTIKTSDTSKSADNEDSLISFLKEYFQRPDVSKIVRTLYSQSMDEKPALEF